MVKFPERHPCFAANPRARYARLHLPVSPDCNIQCRYCNRAFNLEERRPGVASEILAIDGVLARVRDAVSLFPDLTVAGIAGPGEALATEHALLAFEAIRDAYPGLMLCMSTNGLMLPYYADRLRNIGVAAISVTVNAVVPEILRKIVDCANHEELISNQLEGVRLASRFAIVKINTVLIPGINDMHVADVAKAVADAGAHIQNIMPLVPLNLMSHIPAPTSTQLISARDDCGRFIQQFRNCAHCRSDACGIPAKRGATFDPDSSKFEGTFSHG